MGLGYAAAAGIQGGYDALHQMIAERQKQQLLAQAEADKQQQFGLQQAEFEESKRRDLANETRLGEQTTALNALREGQVASSAATVAEKVAKEKARQDALATIAADDTLSPRDKLLLSTQIKLGGEIPGGMFQPTKMDPLELHKQERVFDAAHPLKDPTTAPPSFALAAIMGPDGRPQVVMVDRHDPTQKVDIGAAAPTGAQRGQQSDTEAASAGLDELERLYKDDYVGPAMGRYNSAKVQYTNVKDPQMAAFFAQAAAAKNRIIKAITGAQMSEPEAARIMEQIPLVTDPPVTFRAKLEQSRKNYQFLLDKIAKQSGAGAGVAPASPTTNTDPFGALDFFNPKPR